MEAVTPFDRSLAGNSKQPDPPRMDPIAIAMLLVCTATVMWGAVLFRIFNPHN